MPLNAKDRRGILIAAVAIAILICAGAAGYWISRERKGLHLDSTSLCPIGKPYHHTIVLIDRTDPFSDSQIGLLRSKIEELRKRLKVHEKLSIYVIDDKNYRAPKPSFALCNPGSASTADPLYENLRMLQERFDRAFGEPLEQAVRDLSSPSTSTESPILEMVFEIARVYDFGSSAPARRLMIFSDLMQNTREGSHFKSRPEFSAFRATDYGRRLVPDLTGVEVEIVYLLRPELYQYQSPADHQRFWADYFEASGASQVTFQRAG